MELNFEKLINFDLVEDLEKAIFKEDAGWRRFRDFYDTFHDIQIADSFIRDCPSFPGSTDKIIRSEMVSAIGATLAIEGTRLGADEIEESFRKAQAHGKLARAEQEADNSRKVYEFIAEYVYSLAEKGEELTYTEQLIHQIHKYFTDGLNYLDNVPGQYRGEFPTTFGEPRRVGLCRTGTEVSCAMTKFTNWLNAAAHGPLSANTIVRAIMAHYYLTEIHPFADGNGRTARALEALILYVTGINAYCFWSLANFWSMNRDKYIDELGKIRRTSDPWDLLIWGMKGYLQEIQRIKQKVLEKVKELMLTDYTKYLLDTKKHQKVQINDRILTIVRMLVRSGPTPLSKLQSSPELAALYSNRTVATRNRDLRKMKSLGLVRISGEDKNTFIEANFQILETLIYKV